MSDQHHRVHGVGNQHVSADWPPLDDREIGPVLAEYCPPNERWQVRWLSPRPLSAGALVETPQGMLFIKRHHASVRDIACLEEEHRFIAHLSSASLPVVRVLRNRQGCTATAYGVWTYEIHAAGDGKDLYRDTPSWTPLTDPDQAWEAGAMLARLHLAAADYHAPQRSSHLLVARDELLRAGAPIAALRQQLGERPGLASYLRQVDWEADFNRELLPWHAGLAERLQAEPRLWAHNDWHVSNLLWRRQDGAMRIATVLDFGLASPTSALFDLATAIERNAIAWLALERGMEAIHLETARSLVAGYRQVRPLEPAQVHLLADLLPLVHLDFALSEVEYFHAITASPANTEVAYRTFLLGHARWFGTVPGRTLLEDLHASA